MGWYEKDKGSDEWWVRYADQYGHIRLRKSVLRAWPRRFTRSVKLRYEKIVFARETRPQKGYALRRYEQALSGRPLQSQQTLVRK